MCPKLGRLANVVPKKQRCAGHRTLCHQPTNQAQEGRNTPSTASYRRACFWGCVGENLGMARDYRLVLRDRAFLLPPDMRDWLPEDHFWAWFVLDIVNALEVCAFEATPTPFCNRLHRQENKQQIGKHGALSPRLTTCNKTARHNLARLCVCHACHQVGLLSCGYNHTTIATTNPHQIPKPSSTRCANCSPVAASTVLPMSMCRSRKVSTTRTPWAPSRR